MSNYPHKEIEDKWREIWDKRGDHITNLEEHRNKFYCLVMFSYPSALKLHIGHWYNYAPTDSFARFKRMQGYNVFEPMGFDAFGLPAENFAVKQGIHPAESTAENVRYIRQQLKRVGAMYDWSREVNTSLPQYYRWTQWLFILLYKRGLAYQKKSPVNWCPECQTVLANEQVIGNGECERCGSRVTKRDLKQWFFRITEYAERLLNGLDKVDWPKKSIIQQKNWIGRSEGATIKFPILNSSDNLYIETFTTRADTIFGVTHLLLAPEHPLLNKITTSEYRTSVDRYVEQAKQTTDIERESMSREKTGVFTGAYAKNPLSGERIQIWVADYVLASYGTGAVMAVPAHDQRDFEFAQKYNIPKKLVIQNKDASLEVEKLEQAYSEYGTMVNSGEFNGLNSAEGMIRVAEKLAAEGQGGPAVTYHLHDWLISRQRYWGAPIPIIHCDECGAVPVKESDLPVRLPEGDIDFKPKGKSPLATVKEFMNTNCPNCGKPAKRDPDTMDTFVCSSWYYLRYPCADNDDKPFDPEIVNKWLPVDQYVGGFEHINGHLLYSRFITKVLFDAGLIDFDEPFSRLRHQGIVTNKGAKMSKSKGNVVNPEVFIEKYGSDVFRMYMMFMGDYEIGGDWSDEGIVGINRFVNRIWRLYEEFYPKLIECKSDMIDNALNRTYHITLKSVAEDIENFKFNTAIARIMELVNAIYNAINSTTGKENNNNNEQIIDILFNLPKIIAPLAPHLSEELWHIVNQGECDSVFKEKFPQYDPDALKIDTIDIAVQINGKLRGTITVDKGCEREQALLTALKLPKINKYVEGKNIVKQIFIKDKILNLVVK